MKAATEFGRRNLVFSFSTQTDNCEDHKLKFSEHFFLLHLHILKGRFLVHPRDKNEISFNLAKKNMWDHGYGYTFKSRIKSLILIFSSWGNESIILDFRLKF